MSVLLSEGNDASGMNEAPEDYQHWYEQGRLMLLGTNSYRTVEIQLAAAGAPDAAIDAILVDLKAYMKQYKRNAAKKPALIGLTSIVVGAIACFLLMNNAPWVYFAVVLLAIGFGYLAYSLKIITS